MCFSSGGTKTVTVPATTTSATTASSGADDSNQGQVAAPTYADASVTKATATTRNKAAVLAGRDVRTTTRGLQKDSEKEKRGLLGG